MSGETAVAGAADLLGRELSERDRRLLEVYRTTRALLAEPDWEPCVAAGLRSALAHLAVAVTDLALVHEHLVDESV